MAKLTKTSKPGIFRRHVKGCSGKGRCDCNYVVPVRHRGRQHAETFRTMQEAIEAKGRAATGDSRPTAKVGFGDYFEEWIETYTGRTSRGLTDRSRDLYRRSVKDHALRPWGTWKLSEVEPTDVRKLYGELHRGGVSHSGLRQLRSTLSALFATAVEDGLIRSNPVAGVRIPVTAAAVDQEEKAKALTREQLALLLVAVPEDWRLFFEFLTHTGLRISETIGLRWKHLELGTRPRVLVREQLYEGKRQRLKSHGGRRDVPLSPGMADCLRVLRRDSYRGDKAPVFSTATGSELNRANVASRILKPAGRTAGVPWASFHSFRHTCASMLFSEGRNVKQVAEWLGHADPAFTLRTYVHLLDDGVGDASFFDTVVSASPQDQSKMNHVNDTPVASPLPATAGRPTGARR